MLKSKHANTCENYYRQLQASVSENSISAREKKRKKSDAATAGKQMAAFYGM